MIYIDSSKYDSFTAIETIKYDRNNRCCTCIYNNGDDCEEQCSAMYEEDYEGDYT